MNIPAEALKNLSDTIVDPKELAKLYVLAAGDPVKIAELDAKKKAFVDNLSLEEKSKFNSTFNAATSSEIKALPVNDERRKIFDKQVKSKGVLSAVASAIGLGQIVGANKRLNKLTGPKAPDRLRKNADLATQLNSAKLRQANGDPELRALDESRIAESELIANDRAKTSGQSGRFLANAQANSIRRKKTLQSLSGQESLRRAGARSETNSLIGQSVNEDSRLKRLEQTQYQLDNRDYARNIQALGAQRASGVGNLFGGLSSASEVLPLMNFRKKNGMPLSSGDIFSSKVRKDTPGLEDTLMTAARQRFGPDVTELSPNVLSDLYFNQFMPGQNQFADQAPLDI